MIRYEHVCERCGGNTYVAIVHTGYDKMRRPTWDKRVRVHHAEECALLAQYKREYPSLYVDRAREVGRA